MVPMIAPTTALSVDFSSVVSVVALLMSLLVLSLMPLPVPASFLLRVVVEVVVF